jgi:type II secretory pathway pseudopilin PulG
MGTETLEAQSVAHRKQGIRKLIGLVVVVSLLATAALCSAIYLGAMRHVQSARIGACEAMLSQLEQVLSMYRRDHERLPTDLSELSISSSDRAAYFEIKGRLLDPWKRPFVYRVLPSDSYQLYSTGPDGRDEGGGGDDVTAD